MTTMHMRRKLAKRNMYKKNSLARMKRNGLEQKIYVLGPNETADQFRTRLHGELDKKNSKQ